MKVELGQKTFSRTLSNYVQLTKPGILVLLVLEAVTAMIVAAGRSTSLSGLVGISYRWRTFIRRISRVESLSGKKQGRTDVQD